MTRVQEEGAPCGPAARALSDATNASAAARRREAEQAAVAAVAGLLEEMNRRLLDDRGRLTAAVAAGDLDGALEIADRINALELVGDAATAHLARIRPNGPILPPGQSRW